jgi:hypothetical protein
MAGNEVKLVFAGDSQQLERTFTNVGQSAQGLAEDVDKASRRMADATTGSSTDIAGAIDGSESKFRGFGDVVGGTGDIMEGFRSGNVVGVAMGFADLAGGISDFAIPALTAMKTTLLTGLAPALTAISAHPLIAGILAGGAIIAGLIVLEKKFGLVSKAVDVVKDAASSLLGVLGKVVEGFKDLWNNTVGGKGFDFGGIDLPGPFDVPGFSLRIPRLHTGGMFPGVAGREGLAVLQAGETVIGRGSGAARPIVFNVAGSIITERDLGRIIADQLRNNQLIGVTI